ncbi:hypothetical protein COCNU_06G005010 [Cocos nucifera]|uniref:Mitochondrial ATP synthase subunit G protein n=1 Tax=Cocos nucifera TaxID=13894 RepID=A0A8K0N327_COCNU|nr:hypothetical protein COCNU_06G005010 [Cocos nucifera]
MASKLHQLRSKAVQASELVAKHGCAYYKELMEKNKKYVVDPPTIEKCQELSKQLFYTRLASIPGRYEVFWKELDAVKHIWRNRNELKVEDAGIAALFGLELSFSLCPSNGEPSFYGTQLSLKLQVGCVFAVTAIVSRD